MEKYKSSLEKLFYVLNDDIKDGKDIFRMAKECKEKGNVDVASFLLQRAKTRLDMVEQTKTKIDSIMMSMTAHEDTPYKLFYEETIEWAMELRRRIMEYRI